MKLLKNIFVYSIAALLFILTFPWALVMLLPVVLLLAPIFIICGGIELFFQCILHNYSFSVPYWKTIIVMAFEGLVFGPLLLAELMVKKLI
jgi:hypothetical protein